MSFKFYARIKDSVLQQGYALDEPSFEATQAQYPGEVFLEVDFFCAPDTCYYNNGVVLFKPEKPSSSCFWDNASFSWVENAALKDFEIKRSRNTLLATSDWTQIPNGPLTAEQQQAWAVYRQELRDITSQSGYPFNVIWPTPPQG
jgi:hypothetical protein